MARVGKWFSKALYRPCTGGFIEGGEAAVTFSTIVDIDSGSAVMVVGRTVLLLRVASFDSLDLHSDWDIAR